MKLMHFVLAVIQGEKQRCLANSYLCVPSCLICKLYVILFFQSIIEQIFSFEKMCFTKTVLACMFISHGLILC
uniref:Uncharacterized protein n=1 Tax=Rhizophora mucronata TaxID=61149 RepID=A0A2P2LG09_RHIMU